MLTAEELHHRGRQALNAGRLAEAARILNRGLERPADASVRAEIILTLALIAAERGQLAEGIELCHQALHDDGLTPRVRGVAHSQLGLLHMRSGKSHEALEAFAVAAPALSEDRAASARLHLNRGNIHLQRLDPVAAVHDFTLARDLATEPVESAKAEHNLGYAEFLRGNFSEALRLMHHADAVLDPLSPFIRAVNESDKAEVWSACGMPDQAAAALERAARAFALRRLRQSQGEAELARARVLLHRDPERSITVARKAARLFRNRGSDDWALRAEVVAIGADVARGRHTPRVRERAAHLHRDLTAKRLRADAQSVALYAARGALDAGDANMARTWVIRATMRGETPMSNRLLAQELRARLAADGGRRGAAYAHLRGGLDDLHEWLSEFGSLDLQSTLVGRGRGLAAFGLELAIRDGRPEAVFEWFERARVLVSRVTPVQAPQDDVGSDLAELRHRQEQGADTEELMFAIRQRAWYAPSIGRSARPVSLGELRGRLGNDVIVSVALTEGRLTALVVTAKDARVVPLGPPEPVLALLPTLTADLDMGAAELPAAIAAAVAGSLRGRLATVSGLLIDPIADLIGARRVVVIPAGALAGVPWSLLPGLRGRPLTVARSATHWCACADASPTLRSAGFVTGPGVARGADEVRRAAAPWGPAARLVALDGSAAEVSAIAGTVDVLHVAAHGRHSADNPLFSGIELTGGPWFGYDIDQLARVPSVVLLSACELGRSTVRGAEELVGMTTAWLHAGTRCVIASPTAVNDEVAADLLPRVHRGLAAGEAPAGALAEAMSEIAGLAAFACYGSGW